MVGLLSVPEILTCPVAPAPPVTPPVTIGADHLYMVLAGTAPFSPSVGVTINITPLQVVAVIAVIIGSGLMTTVTVKVAAAPQSTVEGVTVYVAVCVTMVGLYNDP